MPGGQGAGWNSDEAQARLHALAFAADRAARKPPLTMPPATADEKKRRECLNRAKVMLNRDFR